jgi:hypothetical protein
MCCRGLDGFGDELVAIPWLALRFETERRRVVLDATRERLEAAQARVACASSRTGCASVAGSQAAWRYTARAS